MAPMLYKPPTERSFARIVWEELQPYPGRLDLSIRMAVLCVLVTVVAMANEVPEAALSCYLIFFASKDNSGSGILIGLGLIVAASVGILAGVLFLMVSADSPFLRLSFIALFTFGGMYFSQASRLGSMAGTVGFVFAFVMTIYDIVPIAELLTRALTWMWVVVFFPMFFLVLLNVVAPRSPARLLRNVLADRLNAAAAILRQSPGALEQAHRLLGDGNASVSTYQRMARILSLLTRSEAWRMGELIERSYGVLSLAAARAAENAGPEPELAATLEHYAAAISGARLIQHREAAGARRDNLSVLVARLGETLSANYVPVEPPKTPAEPLLAPDAFSNPRYTQFALKTLLAVMICYITYTALDWFEIHTAMITCFYVALGTTGETIHKLTLRIVGCLIGAAMGVGAMIFLVPHMTDIGHLALLIGAGSLIAAWIANGTERISYMGWQAALAFFLCTLGGFGPSVDFGTATNRIIGIVFGNVVVSLVFSTIWPVSVGSSIRSGLASTIRTLTALLRREGSLPVEAEAFHTAARRVQGGVELLGFEAERVKKHEIQPEAASELLNDINALSAPILLLSPAGPRRDPMRATPKYVKAATVRFENTAAQWLQARASDIKEGRWTSPPQPWTGGLQHVEAAFARARRQAGAQGRRLPAAVREEMVSRLQLYRQIDAQIARMADVRAAL